MLLILTALHWHWFCEISFISFVSVSTGSMCTIVFMQLPFILIVDCYFFVKETLIFFFLKP